MPGRVVERFSTGIEKIKKYNQVYHDYIFKQSGMKNSLLIQANKNNLRVRAHEVWVYEEMQI